MHLRMRLNKRFSLTFLCLTVALSGGAASGATLAQAHPGAVASESRLAPWRSGLSPRPLPAPLNPGSRCAPRRRQLLARRSLLRRRLQRRGCQIGAGRSRVPRRPTPSPRAPAPAPQPLPVVSTPAAATQTCTGTDLMPTPSDLQQVRDATLCLINLERAKAGLRPLTVDGTLQSVAQAKSADMVARDYFDHTSPDGVTASDRVLNSGYVPQGASYAIGENIAFGTMDLGTPAKIVQAWMESPGHRENILDPAYRQTGIGVAPAGVPSFSQGQPGGTYTQEFGSHS
ncbi:MAG TPA: CAP domain-containing protein [Solirubrobacteraceae bacterium]|jgi:uncharacterized protein YkwD|nr:CAP domain-containing protein [Solirubrobacteraceae bacterium]